jgi:hypothetical protein
MRQAELMWENVDMDDIAYDKVGEDREGYLI